MKKIFVLFLMLGTFISSSIISFNIKAETVLMEVATPMDGSVLPIQIHAGDTMIFEWESTFVGDVNYTNYFGTPYDGSFTNFYGFSMDNRGHSVWFNGSEYALTEGLSWNDVVLQADFTNAYFDWSVVGTTGTLEFLQDFPSPITGMYTNVLTTTVDYWVNSNQGFKQNGTLMLWMDVELLDVYFITNGGTSIDTQHILEGETATQPVDPTRSGYIFDGWYTSNMFTTEFNFDDPITSTTSIYAKYSYADPVVDGLVNNLPIIASIIMITGSVFYIKFSSNNIVSKLVNVAIGLAIGFSFLALLLAFI